jgi:ribonuclease E
MAPEHERPAPVFDDPQPAFQPQDFAPKPVASSEPIPVDLPESAEPKRRSTVREPAPIFSSEPSPVPPRPQPEPTPLISEEAENADKPRRTGWWARRMGGGS